MKHLDAAFVDVVFEIGSWITLIPQHYYKYNFLST